MWIILGLVTHAFAAPVSVSGGYYGDLVSHPGAVVGISTAVAETDTIRFSLGADLGTYHHRRNHTGAFLRGHFSNRFRSGSGVFLEPRFHLGYLHTWVASDEYWVVDSVTGQNRQSAQAGTPNITLGMGVGVGYETPSGLSVTLRPEMNGRAPYNDFVLSQFALVTEVQWRFGGDR